MILTLSVNCYACICNLLPLFDVARNVAMQLKDVPFNLVQGINFCL